MNASYASFPHAEHYCSPKAIARLCGFIVAAILSLAPQPLVAQGTKLDSWGQALADKLAHFVPEAGPKLVPNPWSGEAQGRRVTQEGGAQFSTVRVSRSWVVGDSGLAELARRKQELERCMVECAMQGKTQEYMNAMQEFPQVGAKLESLARGARRLDVAVEVNPSSGVGPGFDCSDQSARKRVGALAGYPLYRTAVCGAKTVTLEVEVGPEGFTNSVNLYANEGDKGREEVKLIRVRIEADTSLEAVGRELLQRVDYAGLAKLVQP